MFRISIGPKFIAGTCLVLALTLAAPASAQCCGGSQVIPGVGYAGAGEIYTNWQIIEPDAIYLTVNVPEAAILKVNGDDTAMGGARRYFVIRHLEPGRKYKFVVEANTVNAAQVPLQQTTTLVIAAGENKTVTLSPYKKKQELPQSETMQ